MISGGMLEPWTCSDPSVALATCDLFLMTTELTKRSEPGAITFPVPVILVKDVETFDTTPSKAH